VVSAAPRTIIFLSAWHKLLDLTDLQGVLALWGLG
jgi:hypothetical protein